LKNFIFKLFHLIQIVGESSGKPSTTIIKNVEGEVARSKNEFSELQRVIIIHFKVLSFRIKFKKKLIIPISLHWNVVKNFLLFR